MKVIVEEFGLICICFFVGVFTAQLVSGELEYVHMHHPPSLDRRSAPFPASHPQPLTHPHQIYDVPRSSSARNNAARQPNNKLTGGSGSASSVSKDIRRSVEHATLTAETKSPLQSPTDATTQVFRNF